MAEDKICCMFDYKNPNLAVADRKLRRIATLYESSRTEKYLYRCERCGAYVFYEYEEIANLYSGWDNADIFETYAAAKVYNADRCTDDTEINWGVIGGTKRIFSHYQEEDTSHDYIYCDD